MTPVGLLQAEGTDAAFQIPWDLLVGALVLLAIYLAFQARTDVARAMGFERADVMLLTVGALAAPVLNVPVALVGDAVLVVNLGGLLVPLLVIARLAHRGHLSLPTTLLGTALVAPVAWWAVDLVPGSGIVAPFPQFLAPAGAALTVGLVLGQASPRTAGPLAFATGTLGTLVGADLVNLGGILDAADQAAPGTVFALGGGGAFDLIFLSGATGLALSLGLGLATTRRPPRSLVDRSAPPLRVPDADAVLAQADRLSGLTPRERCAVAFARANHALAQPDPAEAVRQAHEGVDALLRSGDPTLLDQLRQGGLEPQLADELRTLNQRAGSRDPLPWHQAADVVEQAKQLASALWLSAPGRVRLEVRHP